MDDIVSRLKNAQLTSNSTDSLIELMEKISATDPKQLPEDNLTKDFLKLLATTTDNQLKIKLVKCIADITKTDSQRKHFTEKSIMSALIDLIDQWKTSPNMELIVQICRALGNIFYQNDDARDILITFNGDKSIIELLDISVDCQNETNVLFITVRCGLISNYLVGGEVVAKRAMEHNIMDKIEAIVGECAVDVEKHEDLLLNILPPLSILTENVPDLNFNPPLNKELVKILAESKNPDIAEMCLDLLHYQA